ISATAVSGQAPFNYTWSPTGTLLGNGSASVQAVPPASLWYNLEVMDAYGCEGTGEFLVIVSHPGAVAAGRILYANAGSTPIAGATIFLLDNTKSTPILDSTLTDDRGYFWFSGLDTMGYAVYPALEGRWGWGGVNATDALLTAQHFVQSPPLTGVWLGAADVNASGGVNTTDAQQIAQRFAGNIPAFASGDWYFEQPLVPAGGNTGSETWPEILALNFGDVNGSNNPTVKATPKVWMEQEGVMSLEEEEEFEIPVKVVEDLEIGSVSLVIHSSQARLVSDIRMVEGLGGILSWSVEGDELRIGWYSLKAVDMEAGSELFYLVFARESAAALAGMRLEVRDNSELSNGAGEVYGYQKLSYPALSFAGNSLSASLAVWPNPTKGGVT
ncbi:MAG: hypothetical protein IH599_00360, partial [Bacteroidales bacterium]|nr:hypothetical protein [Bacteroidales bacterium]